MTTHSLGSSDYENPLKPLIEAATELGAQDPDLLEEIARAIFPDRDDPASAALMSYLRENRAPDKALELLHLLAKDLRTSPETWRSHPQTTMDALVTVDPTKRFGDLLDEAAKDAEDEPPRRQGVGVR